MIIGHIMIYLVSLQKVLFYDGMSILVLKDALVEFTLYLMSLAYNIMILDLGCCNKSFFRIYPSCINVYHTRVKFVVNSEC